jgi:hypothetical protein
MSTKQKAALVAKYGQEAENPLWQEGFMDGKALGPAVSPNYQRGAPYYWGFITAAMAKPIIELPNLTSH